MRGQGLIFINTYLLNTVKPKNTKYTCNKNSTQTKNNKKIYK